MNTENPRFGKVILPGKVKGSIVIRDEATGDKTRLDNPVKEKVIPADLSANLNALVIEAFPKEFQGSEGQSREHDLLKEIKLKYPGEQPMEVAERTLATLVGMGVDAESIAGAVMSKSGEVWTSLNLGSLPKARLEDRLEILTTTVLKHWPSADK